MAWSFLWRCSCLGQACDIEGTWVASETSVGVVATFTFEFNSDGSFSLDEVKEYSNPTCDGEYTFDGRYTLSSSDLLRLTVSMCHQRCFGDCGDRCPSCSTDPLTTVVNFRGDCNSFNMGGGNLYYSRQSSDHSESNGSTQSSGRNDDSKSSGSSDNMPSSGSSAMMHSSSRDTKSSDGGSDWWVYTLIALTSAAVLCGSIAVVALAIAAIVFLWKKSKPEHGNRDEFDY